MNISQDHRYWLALYQREWVWWKSVWIFFWPLAFQGFVRNSFCPERNTGQWVLRSNFWIFSKTWHVDECKIGQRGWSEIIWGIWRLGDFLGQCGTWEPSLGCLDALRPYALNKPPSSGQCPTSRPSDQPGKRLIIVENNFWRFFLLDIWHNRFMRRGFFLQTWRKTMMSSAPSARRFIWKFHWFSFQTKTTAARNRNILICYLFSISS